MHPAHSLSVNGHYSRTTEAVTITVEPTYLSEQSEPAADLFVWAYRVQIENIGSEAVQLLARRWRITDAGGNVQEVAGPGVIGEQPILEPGGVFEYSSGTPLPTPTGFMEGSYQMVTNKGHHFDAIIPVFSLDSPYQVAQVH